MQSQETAMNERIIEYCETTWRGIEIKISFEPNWLKFAVLALSGGAPEN
jgi:hypothetical protein